MDIHTEIKKVKTKDDFLRFLQILSNDRISNAYEWENNNIEDYLLSIKSWIEDMDGYYQNNNLKSPKNIDWSFIANIFYIGKIYE